MYWATGLTRVYLEGALARALPVDARPVVRADRRGAGVRRAAHRRSAPIARSRHARCSTRSSCTLRVSACSARSSRRWTSIICAGSFAAHGLERRRRRGVAALERARRVHRRRGARSHVRRHGALAGVTEAGRSTPLESRRRASSDVAIRVVERAHFRGECGDPPGASPQKQRATPFARRPDAREAAVVRVGLPRHEARHPRAPTRAASSSAA